MQLIPPIPSDRAVGEKPPGTPTMFVALPVFDASKNVIAAFTVRFDPYETLSKIAQNGRLGSSGETYFFNAKGTMISQSRFIEDIKQTGLVPTGESVLAIDIRDPGKNLVKQNKKLSQSKDWPLTYGVQKCLNHDTSLHFSSYRDYRGVKVFGAWQWNETLDIGIITEIDESEALEGYYSLAELILLETFIGLLIFILFLYIIFRTSKDAMRITQQTNNYLKTLIDNSLSPMVTINNKGIIQTYNAAAAKLFGYSLEQVLGENVKMLVPIGHREHHDEYIKHYCQTGEKNIISSSRVVEAKNKDGKTLHLELGLAEAFIENEQLFIATIHDLTQRVLFEERLTTNQMVLNEAQRIGKMGHWRLFIDESLIFCSPTMYTNFGMEPSSENLPFESMLSRVHQDDIMKVQNILQNAIDTKSNIDELHMRIIDMKNTIKYMMTSAELILDDEGNVVEMIGTMMDITQQQEEKEELQLLKYALDKIDEAAYLVDQEANIHYANKGASHQTGYSSDAFKNMKAFELTQDFTYEMWQGHWEELSQKRNITIEMQHQKKDGSLFDVEISANYIEYNKKFYNLGMVRDITKRKESELKILQQQLKLEELNEPLSKKVDVTQNKLDENEKIMIVQSRQAAMGEMISMIVHQWRQPLASIAATALDIKMNIEFDSDTFDKEESRTAFLNTSMQALNDIEIFINNLTTTIDDFRNFYKPDKQAHDVQITATIKKALQIIQSAFQSKGIKIKTIFESERTVRVYESELIQVLINIFKNSQDNFLEKEVSLGIITIHSRDCSNGVCIDIYDNGGGVPENLLQKIFEPYFSTKDEKNGTGLGLYMSKIIIEEHHKGELKAYNNSNNGACFSIKLPIGMQYKAV